MVHYKEISNVEGVEKKKKNNQTNIYIRLHLRCLFVMSNLSKVLYTYINKINLLPQYVHTDRMLYCSSLSNLK